MAAIGGPPLDGVAILVAEAGTEINGKIVCCGRTALDATLDSSALFATYIRFG